MHGLEALQDESNYDTLAKRDDETIRARCHYANVYIARLLDLCMSNVSGGIPPALLQRGRMGGQAKLCSQLMNEVKLAPSHGTFPHQAHAQN